MCGGRGTGSTEGEESAESEQNPESGRGAHAPCFVSDERSRPDIYRCDRSRNSASGAQRIRAGFEPFSHRKTVHLACNIGSAQTHQRRQTSKKEKKEQRQHARGCSTAHGGFDTASQRDGIRGLL